MGSGWGPSRRTCTVESATRSSRYRIRPAICSTCPRTRASVCSTSSRSLILPARFRRSRRRSSSRSRFRLRDLRSTYSSVTSFALISCFSSVPRAAMLSITLSSPSDGTRIVIVAWMGPASALRFVSAR